MANRARDGYVLLADHAASAADAFPSPKHLSQKPIPDPRPVRDGGRRHLRARIREDPPDPRAPAEKDADAPARPPPPQHVAVEVPDQPFQVGPLELRRGLEARDRADGGEAVAVPVQQVAEAVG